MNQQIKVFFSHPLENSCIMFRIIFRVLCKKRGYWTIEILCVKLFGEYSHAFKVVYADEEHVKFRKLLLNFMLWINWVSVASDCLKRESLTMVKRANQRSKVKISLNFFSCFKLKAHEETCWLNLTCYSRQFPTKSKKILFIPIIAWRNWPFHPFSLNKRLPFQLSTSNLSMSLQLIKSYTKLQCLPLLSFSFRVFPLIKFMTSTTL